MSEETRETGHLALGKALRQRSGLWEYLPAVLFVAVAVGAFLPGPWAWGFNHLAYLPLWSRVASLVAASALLFLPRGLAAVSASLAWFGRNVLGRPILAHLVVPVVGAAVFWLLRVPHYFLGDGWLLGEIVDLGGRLHGFDWLAFALRAWLKQIVDPATEAGTFRIFAGVSVAAGFLYLETAAWVSRRLGRTDFERGFLYALLILAARLQIFMGYPECYQMLSVAMLLFGSLLLLYYRGSASLEALGFSFGLGLAFHPDALFLAPALLGPLLWPGPAERRSSLASRIVRLGVGVFVMALTSVAVLLALGGGWEPLLKSLRQSGEKVRLLRPLFGETGFLMPRHWKDLANLAILLAGPSLVLLLGAWGVLRSGPGPGTVSEAPDDRAPASRGRESHPESSGRRSRRQRGAGVKRREPTAPRTWREPWDLRSVAKGLALGLAGVVLVAVFFVMRLGMVRDWDLLAAHSVAVCLLAASLFFRLPDLRGREHLASRVVVAAALLVVPWFALNASTKESLRRFESVIEDLPRFPRAYAHEEIGKYYRKLQRYEEAEREYEKCVSIFPSNKRFHCAKGFLELQYLDREKARRSLMRAFELDSTWVLPLRALRYLASTSGRPKEALEYARRVAASGDETAKDAVRYAELAEMLGLDVEAGEAYVRAAAMGAEDAGSLLAQAGVRFLAAGMIDRAVHYLEEGIARGAPEAPALTLMAAALEQRLADLQEGPARQKVARRLVRVLERLELLGAADEHHRDLLRALKRASSDVGSGP